MQIFPSTVQFRWSMEVEEQLVRDIEIMADLCGRDHPVYSNSI